MRTSRDMDFTMVSYWVRDEILTKMLPIDQAFTHPLNRVYQPLNRMRLFVPPVESVVIEALCYNEASIGND